jgi:diguanylate cyclase (GGDEF)-like protein
MAKDLILIVDDEPNMVQIIEYNLRKAGYETSTANSGTEALESIKAKRPDLIISDVMMPEMDGHELCRIVRDSPATSSIPFFFLTAKGQLSDRIEGLRTGADDYIIKPFEIEELIARVGARLERTKVLRQLAITDGLTGIYNRRYFEERLAEELRRAERFVHPLSVVLLDIDHFKRVNDTYGHLAGDYVLSSFATFLQSNIREVDILARYGGEEMAIIMPETRAEDAMAITRRIAERLKETVFRLEDDGVEIALTFSAGVASFPQHGMNARDIVARVDEAQYRAKKAGRNRICWAGKRKDEQEQFEGSD